MDNIADNENNLVSLDNLPREILDVIFTYIPTTVKVWLNKEYYMKNNHVIKSLIPKTRFNNYIIATIRNDDAFVFDHIINENKVAWFTDLVNNRKYRHGNNIYTCFLYFMYEYCIEQNSNKCRETIERHATELIGPKWHKKNKASSFRRRWSN